MFTETLEPQVADISSRFRSWRDHPLLRPPFGYIIGFALWPLNLLFLSVVMGGLLLSDLPSIVTTLSGYLFIGGFVLASMSSALVMGLTAWNTHRDHIRRQIAFLCPSLLLAAPTFVLYTEGTTLYRQELGVSSMIANELARITFLGPAIGFTFLLFALAVFVYRVVRVTPST